MHNYERFLHYYYSYPPPPSPTPAAVPPPPEAAACLALSFNSLLLPSNIFSLLVSRSKTYGTKQKLSEQLSQMIIY